MPRIEIVFLFVLSVVFYSCSSADGPKDKGDKGSDCLMLLDSVNINASEERFDSLHFEIIGWYAHYYDEKNLRDEAVISIASRIDFKMSSSLHMIDYYASSRQKFCSKFDEIYEELESCLGAESEILHRAQSFMICACVRENYFRKYIDLAKNEVLQYSIIKMETLTEIYKRDTE